MSDTAQELPFIVEQDQQKDFWSVTPTGDWSNDNATGREYGRKLVTFMRVKDAPIILPRVIESMIHHGQMGGIETGFLTYIAISAMDSSGRAGCAANIAMAA